VLAFRVEGFGDLQHRRLGGERGRGLEPERVVGQPERARIGGGPAEPEGFADRARGEPVRKGFQKRPRLAQAAMLEVAEALDAEREHPPPPRVGPFQWPGEVL
jgi:hypothetical protein